jgi:hypothetical protein
VKKVDDAGGVVSIDIGVYRDGKFDFFFEKLLEK